MGISTADVQAWMSDYAGVIAEHREELVALDTAIGDGDHGTNMNRGMQAVVERLDGGGFDDIGALLKAVGMTLVSKVGGAAGPLYGTLFLQMGTALNGKAEAGLDEWADALEAGVAGVQKRGRAEPGDKTMVDALLPAVQALRDAQSDGASLGDALARSEDAAREGMLATTPMEARKGRASYLGPRSVGHQDPGATSSHLLLQTARARFS